MKYSFNLAKDIVLIATYETLVFHAEYETFGAEEIHKRVEGHFGAGFVRRVLSSLAKDGLVTLDQYDESSPMHYTLSDDGFEYMEGLPSLAEFLEKVSNVDDLDPSVPASDRIVTLDHNKPNYAEIAEALDNAIEIAKDTKTNGISGDTHSSLLAGLESARNLWRAFELTEMQFKIGIVMAVEMAETALKTSFKLVQGPLLMEALKAFFKAAKDGNLI